MSKHLLYRKDLPNRTFTTRLLFVLVQLLACLILLSQVDSAAEAAGPLSLKTTSPRYFVDAKGKSVYLTGSYLNDHNTLNGSWEFASYLESLQQQNQNFTRVWGWEQSPWMYDKTGEMTFSAQPYERTGPGLASDGGLKFDLTRFNQAYFDQLRSRIAEAAQRGIYVSVMLFEGFSSQKKIGRVNPWLGDPFQQVNNINGINGDPNQNGTGEEFFSLAFPSLLALQEAFARKVVDTLNDLDNVLYEVSGNGLARSLSWQYRMIDYVKRYQAKKANQHPVGISDFYAGSMAEVFNSSADWIVIPETNLIPSLVTTNKVLVMEGSPIPGSQALSTGPVSLLQLLPDSLVSSQSSGTSNNSPSSNGVTLVSSATTSSTLNTTKSSSNSQQSKVATPTITPNGGIYSGRVAVTLQTTTPGASIYYTTDGQSPTQSSRLYTGKFPLSGSTLVKAKAFKSNFEPSSEASAWFANASAATPSGLVAHWKFDEGSGTSASDSSGNDNAGTLVNGPLWSAGKIGKALFFDGIDDNVTVTDSNFLDLSSAFTLSAWVNPASPFTDFRSILVKNYSYYLYASIAGYCGSGNPLGGFADETHKTVCQPSPLSINSWTHLAVTYNGSALTLYRDGVAVATSTVSGTLSPTTGTLQIGASQYGEYFKGLIDEVRVYNKALTATEIQTIYQQDSATSLQIVAIPVISPNGGSYSGSVSVTMQTATSGASIYYTTNGTTPTQSSTLYTGAMTLANSATVKAKAFKSGFNASAEASASFIVTQPFSFSLANSGDKSVVAGSSVTNSISTTLTSGSAQAVSFSVAGLPSGATALFSSTSCSPTCSSMLTINASSSTVAGSSNITVTAAGGGVTKTTTFSLAVSLQTVATPTISPNGGSFTGSVSVTMQTQTSGASIYYTTNGSTPTQSSSRYAGAMTLTSNTVVKAKAFKSGSNPSAEASASFNVSPSGLVAHWKFDEGSGTSASDSSGNGNAGTLVNGPLWSAGKVGKALFFDGIDDNVTVTDSNFLDLSSAFTLSAWVNPASPFTDFRSILVKNYSYYLYASVAGYCGDGNPLGGFSETTNNTVCQPSPLPINTWTHLTLTYNGSTLTLHQNGVAVATSNFSGTFSPTTEALQVGASQFGEYFKGLIDEVRIYNRALTVTEIQTVYQQDSGATSQPVATSPVTQPFSFSLSNSGDKSLTAGSSVTNSISTTLVSGSSQAVSFSVSGLPSGTTGIFSVPSCSPTCSTVLTVNSTGSTSAGNFPVTVTSTGGGVTRTTAFTLSVTLALTVATPAITPNGGNFSGSTSVAMQTATSGASIYYTTDGSTPSQSSQLYSGAMTLTSSATVNAKAFKSGYNPSSVTSASFTKNGTGKTYYVGKTGNDSNSCFQAQNQATPKLTIKAGIACLASGDTLEVKAGAYNEVLNISGPSGTPNAYTIIRRYGSEVVTINGRSESIVDFYNPSLNVSYIQFDGFILDGINSIAGPPTTAVCLSITGASHIRITNNEIKNCATTAILVNRGFGSEGDSNEFIGNTVHDNWWDKSYFSGNAFYITTDNNLVERNLIYNIGGIGIRFMDSAGQPSSNNIARYNRIYTFSQSGVSGGSGILLGSANNIAHNNIIYNGNGPGISVVYNRPTNNRIYNNTILNNVSNGIDINPDATGTVIKNNIVYNNCVTGLCGSNIYDLGKATVMSNNLTTNPNFLDLSGNFHLQSGSPAINNGVDLASEGIILDYEGIARPQGAAYDIGAFEYH